MKRYKLLRIEYARDMDEAKREFENPTCHLYYLALVVSSEALNKKVDNAEQIVRNVAQHMEILNDDYKRDKFVAASLSFSGFGMDSRVDFVNKLGHLERLCEAIYKALGLALPEHDPKNGYPPITEVWRGLPRDGGRVEVPVVESSLTEYKNAPPWVKGRLKTGA